MAGRPYKRDVPVLAKAVRRVRRTLGLGRERFGQLFGVKKDSVVAYELGRRAPTATTVALVILLRDKLAGLELWQLTELRTALHVMWTEVLPCEGLFADYPNTRLVALVLDLVYCTPEERHRQLEEHRRPVILPLREHP